MTTPIADYGIIGNTRTAALISREGSLDWCCFPRFDSPSFFGKLLDENAGHFQICPVGEFSSEQVYLEDTNVLETKFRTETGTVRLVDCFTVESEVDKRKHLSPSHEILRIVECLSGEVKMKYEFVPSPGYGKGKGRVFQKGKLGIRCEYGPDLLVLLHDIDSDEKTFSLKAEEKKIFSLLYNNHAPAIFTTLGEPAIKRMETTITFWENWSAKCRYKGPYVKEVRRSALALKLLSYSPSGAIIAAPTTSLPEELHGERNWDYRFCWLRDASFTVRSFLGLGYIDEARAFMNWILHTTSLTYPRLQVLYSVYGHSYLPEKKLSWLRGYKNSQPVRIGNAADMQFQLDVYGEVMDAVYSFAPYIRHFDKDKKAFLKGIADSVCDLWELPDEGIWEVRSGRFHHTHSKAMAALALKRFIEIANIEKWKCPLERYKKTLEKISKNIERRGFNCKLKSYTRTFDGDQLDASLLAVPLQTGEQYRHRMETTVEAIKRKLSHNGLIYRYYHEDGLYGNEGAFMACSFWMVECLSRLGRKKEAKKMMDELLDRENALGLWPEELDPVTNEYLGNYPQAFSHTALIRAALSLNKEAS